jgi:hypothetical protein
MMPHTGAQREQSALGNIKDFDIVHGDFTSGTGGSHPDEGIIVERHTHFTGEVVIFAHSDDHGTGPHETGGKRGRVRKCLLNHIPVKNDFGIFGTCGIRRGIDQLGIGAVTVEFFDRELLDFDGFHDVDPF